MKVRQGFVSNSSSSSFLIYGAEVNFSNVKEEVLKEKFPDRIDENGDFDDDGWEDMDTLLEGTSLDIHRHEYSDFIVGVSWDCVKDDETGKQFKEKIQNDFDKIFKNVKCETHEDAWYD